MELVVGGVGRALVQMLFKPLVSVRGQGQLLDLGVKSSWGFAPKSRF